MHRIRLKRLVALLAVAGGISLVSLVSGTATAQTTEVTGSLVALDQGDLVVDLSVSKGAAVGNLVELWRPLKLKHPVSGRMLIDRFKIGTLRLTQVGETLSIATPAEQLARAPMPGDIVILRGAAPQPVRTAAPPPPPPAPARPATTTAKPGGSSAPALPPPEISIRPAEGPAPVEADPEAKLLSDMFENLKGADLVTRIRAYEDYVRAKPQGRFSRVLYEEAQSLRQLLHAPTTAGKADTDATPEVAHFARPTSALAQTPLQITFEIKGPVAGAVMHVRKEGESSYASYPMLPSGRSYFTVSLPAAKMAPPGQEYFVEAVKPDGTTMPLVGFANKPERIEVEDLPVPVPPKKHLYSAAIWTDYADYNRLRHNDWASQTEGNFGMRFGDVGMRSFRSGFGVYRGAGGTINDLDVSNKSPRAIGLTYGYLETELGVSDFVGFVGRGVVGLRDNGITGGAQLLIRIGNDRKTNLQLGGEVLGGVGLRGITQLELNNFKRVPILLRTEVTNQPAGMGETSPVPTDETKKETSKDAAEVGVRAIVQVGYRIIPELTVALRGSYQGRNINHAGPGLGAGITYEW
ncbi:MAG: hypothetical protein HY898_08390 [Deltaproteobacteria bacterium]|nr:hypothetical protein [Deltaproteobacteria bacterium]